MLDVDKLYYLRHNRVGAYS